MSSSSSPSKATKKKRAAIKTDATTTSSSSSAPPPAPFEPGTSKMDVKEVIMTRITKPEELVSKFEENEHHIQHGRKREMAQLEETMKNMKELKTVHEDLNDKLKRVRLDNKTLTSQNEELTNRCLQLEKEKMALMHSLETYEDNTISTGNAQRMFRLFEVYKALTGFLIVNDEVDHGKIRIVAICANQQTTLEFKGHVQHDHVIVTPGASTIANVPSALKVERKVKLNDAPALMYEIMTAALGVTGSGNNTKNSKDDKKSGAGR